MQVRPKKPYKSGQKDHAVYTMKTVQVRLVRPTDYENQRDHKNSKSQKTKRSKSGDLRAQDQNLSQKINR